MSARTDFEIRNARDTLLGTYDDPDLARKRARERALTGEEVRVERVEHIAPRRDVIYTPRPVTERQGATVTQLRRTAQ